jgi:hypothetical protein
MKFAYSKELPDSKYKGGLMKSTVRIPTIKVKEKEYTWIISRNRFSGRLKRLWLYNVTDSREEDNLLLVDDMLKILHAWFMVTSPVLVKALYEYSEEAAGFITFVEQRLAEQKSCLGKLKMEMPRFAYIELVGIVQLLEEIINKQKEMTDFIIKYYDLSVHLLKMPGEIPVKILLLFYEDFFLYWRALKEVRKKTDKLKKQDDEYLSLILNRETFHILYEVLDTQKEEQEVFSFYNKIPLMKEMIEMDFSEHITDRYRPLVQTRTTDKKEIRGV